MPRRDRPTSSRRPHHVRLAMLALGVAVGVLLAAPAPTPRGEVLDLVGTTDPGAAIVSGQEPSPAGRVAPRQPAVEMPSPRPVPANRGTMPAARFGMEPPAPLPALDLTGYAWPIAHPRLTLPFGPTAWGTRIVDGDRFHDGIDLATFCGDRIAAAHAGTVLAAGRHFDKLLGWVGDLEPYFRRLDRKQAWSTLPIVVVVDDGNGYRSVYAHFERVTVRAGDRVAAGQLIGYEGATGHASGCHLHYSLFSPWESATFAMRPDVMKRMKLPGAEIARIDPLLVLPWRRGIDGPASAGARAQGKAAGSDGEPTSP